MNSSVDSANVGANEVTLDVSSAPLPPPCSPPVFEGSCKPRYFLDIFSGASMPVSSACRLLHIDVFEPVDLIHGHDLLNDDTFHNILVLAESGLIGAALAAPYCSKHSRATLRKPGPRPVRTPAHLDGVPDNTVDQQLSVQESSIIHDRARLLLSAVDR